jgi:Uma2 family endonuclease
MATIPIPPQAIGADPQPDYPTGDGKPLAETPIHRDNLLDGVKTLESFFADEPMVYVSGNMLVYYEQGNPRKHVAPDVFVALGVPKAKRRDAYFVWLEPRGPSVVIELTSKSTRREDLKTKMAIYQDKMPVPEYFLFDPREEYLEPSLQGYRLRGGVYVPIESVGGRLPSEGLGLELERSGEWLRYYDPTTGRRLLTPQEQLLAASAERERAEAERQRAEAERQRAEAERQRAEAERQRAETECQRAETECQQERTARQNAEAEVLRLRQELEQLRRR